MDISCAFAPVPETPAHIALAERLGYRRAWAYDTPALQLDAWMTLARAADLTERIDLGTAVLIPNLRHVLVTASAIATLVDLAPGRVNVGIGSGFTGRMAMGQRPLPWATVARYVGQLRSLLAGETVEVEGALCRLLHGPGQAPSRPISVPILIGIAGPKGEEVARQVGNGIFVTSPRGGFPWVAMLTFGTVLDRGEDPGSDRAVAAAGPAAAVAFHGTLEFTGSVDAVRGFPGGDRWAAALEAIPVAERHLAVHEGHLTHLNALDRPVITGDHVASFTFCGEAAPLRERLAAAADAGVTEVAFQPAGDIERELTAFAAMAGIG